jgi:hypothetical protein
MFIAVGCPTTNECIKKMWYLYTVEFYSATKKNEILSFASKWLELENIILSNVRLRSLKIICSPSYMDFRSETNAATLLEWVTCQGENAYMRNREGRKPQN